MPTNMHRINLSVPHRMDVALQTLAKRDRTSLAAKTLHLLQQALELEEDVALMRIAEGRDGKKTTYLSHKTAWKQLTR